MQVGQQWGRRHAGAIAALASVDRAIHEVMGAATPLAVATGLLAPVTLAPGLLGGIATMQLGDGGAHGSRSWLVGGMLHGLLDATVRPGGLAFAAVLRVAPGVVAPAVPAIATTVDGRALLSARSSLQHLGFAVGAALCAVEAAQVVAASGNASSLVTTRRGRSVVLQALGSALAIGVTPLAQLASAACFAAALLE